MWPLHLQHLIVSYILCEEHAIADPRKLISVPVWMTGLGPVDVGSCQPFKQLWQIVACLIYRQRLILHGAAPGYLRDYCKETHSSASGLRLRSTDKCDLLVRRMKTRFSDRAFSAAGPRCWNKLPAALHAANSIDSFKTGLKTYLFSKAYSAVSWL